MSNKQIIRVLKKARNLIAKGWTQGPLNINAVRGRNGSPAKYCAYGALLEVRKGLHDAEAALNDDPVVKRFVSRKRGLARSLYGARPFVSFNEAKGRTQSQVVALFDRTIARLEKQTA